MKLLEINESSYQGDPAENLILVLGTAISTAFLLYFSCVYLPLSHQFLVGWGILIPLAMLKRSANFNKKIPVRILFLLLATFISMRYWFWRTSSTLFYTGFFDFCAVMLLYMAESYSISVHLLGMFVNIWPLNREPVPLPADVSQLPKVDIFIPTYSEPVEIVRVTATACTQIDYPPEKLRIYILDDGGTVARRNNPKTAQTALDRHNSFKKMAEELGASYLTREKNEHAKAGNINEALKHTDGELVLILDCDHVPTRDILKNTVGLFIKDEKLFLVQTPHFFVNPSPVEKNLSTFMDAPSENEMFYGSIQLGLDFWNSAFFCGSAAVLRRKCLEEVGGVVGETITEDAETALALHSKGYNSAYISRPMVCGLSPETFDDFILQRSRWSQGMTQIFILKNPLLLKGLSLYQRLCYTNSCFFWFFGMTGIAFYLAPLAYLFFGLKIYNASVEQVLAYALPHVVGSIIVSDYLYGRVRWSFFSELYESVQSIFVIPAIISVILNPRAPTFKVTPKGKSLENDFLSPLAGPFYVMLILILAGFPFALIKWFSYPMHRDVIAICTGWSVYNLVLVLACLGVVWEKRYTRRFHRIETKGSVKLFVPRLDSYLEGQFRDLSLTGAGINIRMDSLVLNRNEEVFIESTDSYGEEYKLKAKISWIKKKGELIQIGCEYALFHEGKETFSELVRFFYGDSQRWVDFREARFNSVGFYHGLAYLAKKGVQGGWENIKGITLSGYLKTRLFGIFRKIDDDIIISSEKELKRV